VKITIWIRPGEGRVPVCRTDYKFESLDTPRIQNYGRRLLQAIEGGDEDEKGEDNG
jgi:hypothetical protein